MAQSTNTSPKVTIPAYLRASRIIVYIMYVWVYIGIIALSFRMFLLAFSANPNTPFVDFVYRTSADYLAPFRGIFPPKTIGETGYFDVAALFAIIMYMLVAWGFSGLLRYIQYKIDESALKQKEALARASHSTFAAKKSA